MVKRKLFFLCLSIFFVSHGMEDPGKSLGGSLQELKQKLQELSLIISSQEEIESEEYAWDIGKREEEFGAIGIAKTVSIDSLKRDFVQDILGQPENVFRGRSNGLGWWNGVLKKWDPVKRNKWIKAYPRRAAIFAGHFAVHSLGDLKDVPLSGKRGSFRVLFHDPRNAPLSDIHYLQTLPENYDAVFQLASTFYGPLEGGMMKYKTLLENMTHAPVQGEWASIGTIGATLWRKYFMPTEFSARGKSPNKQYPKVADAARREWTKANRELAQDYFSKYFFLLAPMWPKGLLLEANPMARGNIFKISSGSVKKHIANLSADDVQVGFHEGVVVSNGRDRSGKGVYLDFEVLFDGSVGKAQRVNQAFVSAVDLKNAWKGDGSIDVSMELFAQLCLRGAYLGTLYSAARHGKKKVYLTLMGGGSFVNDIRWINNIFDDVLANFIKSSGMEVILMYRADTKGRVVDIRNAKNDYEFLRKMIEFAGKVNGKTYRANVLEPIKVYADSAYAGAAKDASRLAEGLNAKFMKALK